MLDDLRAAARQLRREPRFSISIVLLLSLGAGANLSVFAVVNTVLWRTLPYRDPDRLVRIWEANPSRAIVRSPVSRGNFADWRSDATSFEAIEAFSPQPRDELVQFDGDAEVVRVGAGTPGLTPMLGVPPLLASGDAHGYRLSHGFWRRRFAESKDVLGAKVVLEGFSQHPLTITAVMPRSFDFPSGADMWSTWTDGDSRTESARAARNLHVVARLKPGVTLAQAQEELAALEAQLARDYPRINEGWTVEIQPLQDVLTADVGPSLRMLYLAVSLLLLVATANVATLCLARRVRRIRDISVRIAIGATPWRILRLAAAESALLAGASAACGLGIAAIAIKTLVAAAPAAIPRVVEIRLDARAYAATAALALLMATVMTVLVSARATVSLRALRGGHTPALAGRRLRGALVILEIAACACLLIVSATSIDAFLSLQREDLGFRPDNVLAIDVRQPIMKAGEVVKHYPTRRFLATADAAVESAASLPGVEAVGLAWAPPLARLPATVQYRPLDHAATGPLTGAPPVTGPGVREAGYQQVDPGYFDALGIQIVAGRAFRRSDRLDERQIDDFDADRGAGAAIVSASFARRVWPGASPIGRYLAVDLASYRSLDVVGLVSDVVTTPGDEPRPTIYVPYGQNPVDRFTLLVRANDPLGIAGPLRTLLRDRLGTDVATFDSRTYHDIVATALARPRFTSRIMSSFGTIALVMTSAALYAVLSFLVLLRAREIAIRMSLGANPRGVALDVFRNGLALCGAGMALGTGLALLLTRIFQARIGGLPAAGAIEVAVVSVAVFVAGAAASYVPARRAARVDPILLLKAD